MLTWKADEVPSKRLLSVLSPVQLARIVLDPKMDGITRFNAAASMQYKLSEFNGAMWIGVSLNDRADVIRALREINRIETDCKNYAKPKEAKT